MENVIITGANGFIGNLLVKRFVKEGFHVYAAVREGSRCRLLSNENITVISTSGILKIKDQVEGTAPLFYHFAWQGVNGPDKVNIDVQLRNIEMAADAARTAKILGCSKFLCAGSIAERSLESLEQLETVPGGMLYAAAKQSLRTILDVSCRQIGLNHIWMQFSNVYGPSNMTGNIIGYTLERLFSNRNAEFGPASQPYDLIYEDDLAEACYRLGTVENKKHFYYIGSGHPRLLKEYLNVIGKLCDKQDYIKTGVKKDDGIRYSMDMFDTSQLEEEIGCYVKQPFDESMKLTADFYKELRKGRLA